MGLVIECWESSAGDGWWWCVSDPKGTRDHEHEIAQGSGAADEAIATACAEAVIKVLGGGARAESDALPQAVAGLAAKLQAWHRIATGDGDHTKADIYSDVAAQLRALTDKKVELPDLCPRCRKDEIVGDCSGNLICMGCGVLDGTEDPPIGRRASDAVV